jgi:hypothetical protein
MLLHTMLHLPGDAQVDLWPHALDYTTWIYNQTPSLTHGWAPIELLSGIVIIYSAQEYGDAQVCSQPRFKGWKRDS